MHKPEANYEFFRDRRIVPRGDHEFLVDRDIFLDEQERLQSISGDEPASAETAETAGGSFQITRLSSLEFDKHYQEFLSIYEPKYKRRCQKRVYQTGLATVVACVVWLCLINLSLFFSGVVVSQGRGPNSVPNTFGLIPFTCCGLPVSFLGALLAGYYLRCWLISRADTDSEEEQDATDLRVLEAESVDRHSLSVARPERGGWRSAGATPNLSGRRGMAVRFQTGD